MIKYKIYTLFLTLLVAFQLPAQSFFEIEKLVPNDIDDNDMFGSAVAIDNGQAVVAAGGKNNEGMIYFFEQVDGHWTENGEMGPAQTDTGTGFGKSVSLDEEYGIVGYWYANEYANASGCAYILYNDNGNWTKQQKLLPDTGFYQDRFGNAVDIYGNYAVVGAQFEARNGHYGAAYIFYNNNGSWELQQKLTANDATFGDSFGSSVAIHENYVMIGAKGVDNNATNTGAVYIYERTGSTWQQTDKVFASDNELGIRFGHSLSMDGDFAVVGAPSGEMVINAPFGYAYIFENVGGNWQEVAKLTASDQEGGDEFGHSVSIKCDRVVVGAWYTDDLGTSSGSAYIFVNNQGTWEEDQILVASDGGAFNLYGSAVGISCENVIVGEPHNSVNGSNSGTAYIYGGPGTGVQSLLSDRRIQLYPNPAEREVLLNIPGNGVKYIRVTDLSGKIMLERSTHENNVQLNINSLENGYYIFQVQTRQGNFIGKMIKK